jgi:uncharacterized DUF497 family protein
MVELNIEWDPQKAEANQEKHGVSFDEASTAFSDENGRLIPDPDHSEEEDRFILLGMSWSLRILVVCHCYRKASNIIRIISARKATKSERAQYGARKK